MTSIFNKALFSILGLAATLTILVSCEKDKEDKDSGMVELLSFGPTGARHGDTIRFIGRNLDQVTAIQFTGTLPWWRNQHSNCIHRNLSC